MELEENSRLSADSRISDSNSMQAGYSEPSANNDGMGSSEMLTEFKKEMFHHTEENSEMGEKSYLDSYKVSAFQPEYILPDMEAPGASKGLFTTTLCKLHIKSRESVVALVL